MSALKPLRFRKRPVVIEAMQYTGGNASEIAAWMKAHGAQSGWTGTTFFVHTLEGRMDAKPGDRIIRGVAGEFYPCKPDIFAATYEAAEALMQEGDAVPDFLTTEDDFKTLDDLLRRAQEHLRSGRVFHTMELLEELSAELGDHLEQFDAEREEGEDHG